MHYFTIDCDFLSINAVLYYFNGWPLKRNFCVCVRKYTVPRFYLRNDVSIGDRDFITYNREDKKSTASVSITSNMSLTKK